ncbi:hypothetical protein C7N83_00150 [Neisseria iguanae]|uniref:Uncharacterized protein n=1 Tax=Neisseria iguanae TaxID=90242 RepID=A0A2P7U3G0_9NEIS|nr:hypothetical protein C7N83_00150 [Neisseria iguanae]
MKQIAKPYRQHKDRYGCRRICAIPNRRIRLSEKSRQKADGGNGYAGKNQAGQRLPKSGCQHGQRQPVRPQLCGKSWPGLAAPIPGIGCV